METIFSKPFNLRNIKLVTLAALSGFIGLFLVITYLTRLNWTVVLSELSAHHYFFMCFTLLLVAMSILRVYYLKNEPARAMKSTFRMTRLAKKRKFPETSFMPSEMPELYQDSIYIRKEEIPQLKFNSEEILESKASRDNRVKLLQKARLLGNVYKQKVIICFKDMYAAKHTIATVWHTDEKHVCLKGGAIIPVNRIYKIEL